MNLCIIFCCKSAVPVPRANTWPSVEFLLALSENKIGFEGMCFTILRLQLDMVQSFNTIPLSDLEAKERLKIYIKILMVKVSSSHLILHTGMDSVDTGPKFCTTSSSSPSVKVAYTVNCLYFHSL